MGNEYAVRKRLLYPHSLSLDAVHLLPYVDSASWLYLDPNPVFPVHMPSFKCDESLCGQQYHCQHRLHHHRHHHHHQQQQHQHYHHRHCRQRRHRRVLSDPGVGGCNGGIADVASRHRRVLSSVGADLMRASIDEANEEDPSPEETRASTFRKVPWHPNLHMLKIRRT